MSEASCPICLGELLDASDVMALACAHTFHKYCIEAYCNEKQVDVLTIKCPCCKLAGADLQSAAADAALEGTLFEDEDAGGSALVPVDEAPDATSPAVLQHPKFDSPSVFCSTCGNQAVMVKCRLLSKKAGTWRCDVCQCRIVQLHRGVGGWPPKEFSSISEDDQRRFMASLREQSGAAAVAAAKDFIKKHEVHEVYYEFSGEFLPLTVWGVRGFNVDDIEQKSPDEDRQKHPVLGTVYRVKTLKAGTRGTEGMSKICTLESKAKKVKVPALEPVPIAAIADADAQHVDAASAGEGDVESEGTPCSDSDSSSKSSSSESSVKRKKSKKDKKKNKKSKKHNKNKKGSKKDKDKKSKKDQQLAEKKAQALAAAKAKKDDDLKAKKEAAAQAAKDKQTLSFAQQIVNKVSNPMSSMTSTLAKPDTLRLPDFVIDAAKMHLNTLQNLLKEAQLAQASPSGKTFLVSLKDVGKAVTDAKKHEVLMSQMMATLQKIAA